MTNSFRPLVPENTASDLPPHFVRSPRDILARLHELRAADAPDRGGRVLSYVYDSGLAELDRLAGEAMAAVQHVNALDPTTFTSVAVMEREVVGFARQILHAGHDVVASITTGGTESCLLAVKTARDVWVANGGVGQPRLLAPVTAHAAFHKAAEYFGLRLDLVPVDPASAAVDSARLIEQLGDDVALVVVSAPSYPFALLEPVADVAEACRARGIACHVDACVGGLVLPWWHAEPQPSAGEPGSSSAQVEPAELPVWDFRVPGVTSMSADLHKFGYAPKGISLLLQRGRDRQRHQMFVLADWPGYPVINPTILGTKSAAPLAAAWAIVHALGETGLAELAASCQRATRALVAQARSIGGMRVVGEPVGPLFAVAADESVPAQSRVDPHHWADRVRELGWQLQPQPGFMQPDGTYLAPTTHLTVTPVTESALDELLAAMVRAADDVRGVPRVTVDEAAAALPAEFVASLAQFEVAGESADAQSAGAADFPLSSEEAVAILHAAGMLSDEGVPEAPGRMAGVMALLEVLPTPLKKRLLTELFSRIPAP